MKTLRPLGLLPVFAALALGACDDSGPTALTPDEQFSFENEIALAVIADPAAMETALGLIDAGQGAMQRQGMSGGNGRVRGGAGMGNGSDPTISALRDQARVHFMDAQSAYMAGDFGLALDLARSGRMLVAEAIQMSRGPHAIIGMVEHMEAMSTTIPGDPALYQNAQGLGLEMGHLGQNGRGALGRGDHTGAGQLGVLGQQRSRQGTREHRGNGQPDTLHVRLKVEFGATAIDLAERILTEQGADAEQEAVLASAKEFQARAENALAEGDLRAAVHLANLAEWNALKAVVLPGGITDDEQRAMIDLATSAYAAALAAVGDAPTELQAELLLRAERMLTNGEDHVLSGNVRGVGALWRSAVISTWLIG
jgi:hypothetical protein